jgi:hypothetical protein
VWISSGWCFATYQARGKTLSGRSQSRTNSSSINRKPNVDQYNDMNFTAADPAASSGAVSGYRVAAYQDDGSGQGLGPFYGQSDMVLAVPNQETVGY